MLYDKRKEREVIRMKQKIASFMYGRYGADELSKGILILYIALAVVMLFIGNPIVRLILHLLSLALFIVMFYRMFSRNITKRTAENQKYLAIRKSVKSWFLLRRNRWKYRKTHVYRKCPHCKAQIRLPKVKGEHKCACPKCGDSFDISIK